jgi:Bacterial Ig domain/Lysyl oxidase
MLNQTFSCMRTLVACLIAGSMMLSAVLAAQPAFGALATDTVASTDRSSRGNSIASPSFSTKSGNELLLAFVSTDASSSGVTVTGVTGAGVTWALVRRTNVQMGTAEIWRAFAPAAISAATVTATLSQSVAASVTIVSFSGVDTTGTNGSGAIGSTNGNSAASGAPSVSVTTTRNGSWVFGVGNDWDNAIGRTPGANQSLVHQYLASVGDTYWVQKQNAPTAASGTQVFINDTAPTTDRYNLSIVEVLPSTTVAGSFSATGTITPSAAGNQAVVSLSGAGSGSATADSTGTYTFTNLANGTYTATPTKPGYVFTPSSQPFSVNGTNASIPNIAASPTFSISGSINPSTAGSGTVMGLSGTASATTNVVSGSYSFAGLLNGSYTVTPTNTADTFTPPSQSVTVNGNNISGVNFSAQTAPPTSLLPDLSDIIPIGKISVVQTSSGKQFQYTHDTFNGGPGPLVIQPVYNPASGTYQGTQYIYSRSSSGVWTITQQIPIAGAFIFDSDHGHFHFPFTTYGLYGVATNGGIGAPVALSGKISFCINDSFIYDSSLPNAGQIGNLGSCGDPTTLRGLNIGAVDEYDQTDPGQSISLTGVPDGTYWLKALVDPDNFFTEKDKTNNETDVELTISGTSVQILQTVTPTLNNPPSINVTSPASGATVSKAVQLSATTGTSGSVQFLIDGQNFGGLISAAPYSTTWDTTTVPNGTHWLAAQTSDSTGIVGTSTVVMVTVSNGTSSGPTVQLTSPATGSILSATVTLYATVASSQPITNVTFFVDNVVVGTPLTSPPYMISWNTATVPDGQHVIGVSATDSLGNVGNAVPVTLTVDNSNPPLLLKQEVVTSVDGAGSLTTNVFSTPTASDLLVAFVSYDGPNAPSQTANVSGAGLSWTLLERSNTEAGTSEIWSARADGILSNVTVNAVPGIGSASHGSLTVIAFANAAGTSVVGRAGATSGAPDIILPGVVAGDWCFAVGNDWDHSIARTPVSGQVLVHQKLDAQVGDTYWVQSTTAPSAANALVDIHDSAPTNDRWNYAAVEIVVAHQ